jgi:hypothetical protein
VLDELQEVAEKITMDAEGRSLILSLVAKALARRHQFRKAREVAESCDLPIHRLDAFTTILGEYARKTMPELVEVFDKP